METSDGSDTGQRFPGAVVQEQDSHSVHDIWGRRIAEYLYDAVAGTSELIHEYIRAGDRIVGLWEDGAFRAVRTDHIGRPVGGVKPHPTGLMGRRAEARPTGDP